MLKKAILFLLFPLFFYSQAAPNSIKIRSSSSIYVEANVIKFNLHIKCENEEPQKAFEEHKKLEKKLLALLNKFQIPDTTINYSLLNIRKSRNRDKTIIFQTKQDVIITLNSIKDYTSFQIELLNSGFYEFDATFSTNNLDGIKEKGYKKAMKVAKEDALAIAKAMNKKLGDILEINTTTREVPYIDAYRSGILGLRDASASDKDMTEIKQSVQINTQLEIVFEIINK